MMVLDYSERKPVSRNKPKKQPVNFFAIFIIGAVVISFAGGVLTGWLIFGRGRGPAATAAAQPAQNVANGSAEAGKSPAVVAPRGQEPPLTFYESLPKGQALIGSGFNPKKTEGEVSAKQPAGPVAVPQSQAVTQQKPSVNPPASARDEKKGSAPPASQIPAKDGAKKPAGTYTVQVASFKDRKEAEATVARIIEKGLAAYVSESSVPGKGVWYRVRIGRRLSHEDAADLAARSGKGAQPIPE